MRAIPIALAAILLAVPAFGQDAAATLNALRTGHGAAPVRMSPALQAAAEGHARDMAKHGYFSHKGRDGSNLGDRARRQGFGRCYLNESIAMVGGNLNDALSQWMASPAHRSNLLERKAQVFGLGNAGGNLWVLMLGEDC